MTRKNPILIWRLRDAPEEPFREDAFYEDEEGYRRWREGKTGDEFVVMIPEGWVFDDPDAAFALGLNVTEEMREHNFGGEQSPDCEAFTHLHYGKSETGLSVTYDAYVVPSLVGRDRPPSKS